MIVLSSRKEPALLVLLQAIVKVEEINLPIKGNQNSVMKFFMEHRESIAPMLADESKTLSVFVTTAEQLPQIYYFKKSTYEDMGLN